jgi:hypothetical protein
VNVTLLKTTHPDLPLTTPFPPRGVMVRWLRGDLCDPIADPDGWYGPRWPLITIRAVLKFSLPFIAWRFGPLKGYIGAKVYGYIPEYRGWWPEKDCHEGSQAMCLSFRPFSRA